MSYQSVFRSDLFTNKVVLVTGGGSGIGRCTAHELASLGARVILAGRRQDALDAVAAEIIEDGGAADTAAMDIRDENLVRASVARIVASHGPVHGLVNNAGGQFPSPLANISAKGFRAVVDTNLTGGFLVAREVFNQSMKESGGAIVNITADCHNGMPMMGHSGAARAGMENFTRTAAVEWGAFGVRINAVAPGWIASSGLDTYDDPGMRQLLPRLKEAVPIKRLATEAEVSAGICFLLSDGAAFISGATLRIDAGGSLQSAFYPLPPARNVTTFQGFHRYRKPKALGD